MFSTLHPSPETRISRRLHRRKPASVALILAFRSSESSSGRMNLAGRIVDVCAYGIGVEVRATQPEIVALREAGDCKAFLHTGDPERALKLTLNVAWIGLGDDPAASRTAFVYRIGFICDRSSREELLDYRKYIGAEAAAGFNASVARLATGLAF